MCTLSLLSYGAGWSGVSKLVVASIVPTPEGWLVTTMARVPSDSAESSGLVFAEAAPERPLSLFTATAQCLSLTLAQPSVVYPCPPRQLEQPLHVNLFVSTANSQHPELDFYVFVLPSSLLWASPASFLCSGWFFSIYLFPGPQTMVSLTPRAFDLTVFHAFFTRLRQSSTHVKIAI